MTGGTGSAGFRPMRVGSLRPNQLLYTYGVGAMADLPNLSVVMLGLDFWSLERSQPVAEQRLLTAVRAKLGRQVEALRLPPYLAETADPFGEWTRVGVPVALFPSWLRCTACNLMGRADTGPFELQPQVVQPNLIRYAHRCRGKGRGVPSAVPARFVLACDEGHLDDFPWLYYLHRGTEPESGHPLSMVETGSTGEASNVLLTCRECPAARPMSEAFGPDAETSLPACRGRHPHLATFEPCDRPTRTMVLGATNSWFPMQLSAFTLPRARNPLDHLIAEFWGQLELVAGLPAEHARALVVSFTFWPELEPHGWDQVWRAVQARRSRGGGGGAASVAGSVGELDLLAPEWAALTDPATMALPDFTTHEEDVPATARPWLDRVVLVSRLRQVSALYGFTRIDAPEWEVQETPDSRCAPLSSSPPTWVPCAELRGEGVFLRFAEDRITEWERGATAQARERQVLVPAHRRWREQRQLEPDEWPELRYVLLHTFAHTLIRELALDSGYSAAGIGERIYARTGGAPMAGVLLYTAAPDSEGTLGGLVSLGRTDRLGALIDRALEAARMCSSDPLCAEHDPRVHGRLYGAACHACLFAAETSCERGNQYLDRALLVDTLATTGCGFFG